MKPSDENTDEEIAEYCAREPDRWADVFMQEFPSGTFGREDLIKWFAAAMSKNHLLSVQEIDGQDMCPNCGMTLVKRKRVR